MTQRRPSSLPFSKPRVSVRLFERHTAVRQRGNPTHNPPPRCNLSRVGKQSNFVSPSTFRLYVGKQQFSISFIAILVQTPCQVGDWTQELFTLGLGQPRLPLWITAAQPSLMEKSIYYDNSKCMPYSLRLGTSWFSVSL